MTFDSMIDFIIDRIEKGYANDPKDKGGETNWGISVRAYPELKGRMKTLTREEAKSIYRRDYFMAAGIARYPARVRLAVLDGAINHGVGQSNKLVQKALNLLGTKVVVDGEVGPVTVAALKKVDPLEFLVAYSRLRLELFRRLDDYAWAGPSWERRIFLVCSMPA